MLIPIIISFVSLFFSFLALYFSWLRPANIEVFAGEKIAIWHDQNGWICFDIPVTISNTGTKLGIINSMAVLFEDPNKSSDSFLLNWSWFLEYRTISEPGKWYQDEFASTIIVNKDSSISKYVLFIGPEESKDWLPAETKYRVKLFAWSKKQFAPDHCDTFEIEFDKKNIELIKKNRDERNKSSAILFRNDWGSWRSKRLSLAEINQLRK